MARTSYMCVLELAKGEFGDRVERERERERERLRRRKSFTSYNQGYIEGLELTGG
jgi:hypothetical protein